MVLFKGPKISANFKFVGNIIIVYIFPIFFLIYEKSFCILYNAIPSGQSETWECLVS